MNNRFGVIIVTHNSAKVISKCVESLQNQSYPACEIVVVDSGSTDTSYLDFLNDNETIRVIRTRNIGFAQSNNMGIEHLSSQVDILICLNPDTFLTPTFIEQANKKFRRRMDVKILSGRLLGYNLAEDCPNGKIDSCGIFRKWYGRWFDRGQGEVDENQYNLEQRVPALCGALICCRIDILKLVAGQLFDPDFFMYKEDIEMSIRIRKRGIKLLYCPDLIAYHCRGWKRRDISRDMRKLSSKNEILLYRKHPSPYMLWALLKYFLVSLLSL